MTPPVLSLCLIGLISSRRRRASFAILQPAATDSRDKRGYHLIITYAARLCGLCFPCVDYAKISSTTDKAV
uniref:Putative secreted protein n=1 Tax=Anopheles darlingi TaxID=43151 RepID=A0A2M4DDD8_ANODA